MLLSGVTCSPETNGIGISTDLGGWDGKSWSMTGTSRLRFRACARSFRAAACSEIRLCLRIDARVSRIAGAGADRDFLGMKIDRLLNYTAPSSQGNLLGRETSVGSGVSSQSGVRCDGIPVFVALGSR